MDPAEPSSSVPSDPLAALREPVVPTAAERARALLRRIPHDARPWALAVAVLALVVVGAGALLAAGAVSGPGRAAPAAGDEAFFDAPVATTAPRAVDTSVPRLVAHAAGAVVRPGVYELSSGARVDDLIAAAGGVTGDADADRLNLAAPLQDGARLYVPRRGELDVPAVSGPDAAPGDGAGGTNGGSGSPSGPVDLNRAGQAELEALPGIGPSLAQAILDHRTRDGPFSSVDGLLDVRGIGPTRLEQLRPLVRV